MTCGECGSKNIVIQNVNGRVFRWKDFQFVKNTQDLHLHVCAECNNIITKVGDGKRIDDAIKLSIAKQIAAAINQITDTNKCEQREIARRIGRSMAWRR